MSVISTQIGSKLLSKDDEGNIVESTAVALEEGEVLGLYFSAHWCPPCRQFTPKLAQFYKNLNKNGKRLRIIFISSDRDLASFQEYYQEMPWDALPFEDREKKTQLSAEYRVSGIPNLVLIDGEGNRIKTSGDVRSLINKDMEGKNFPWPRPSVSELLKGDLIDKLGTQSTFQDLEGSILGIYFSAHWCPPCRGFTPELVQAYEKIKEKSHNFEIVFVSGDRDEKSFQEYLNTMPWKSLPFGCDLNDELNEFFQIDGIPTLIILDAERNVITKDGRSRVASDVDGVHFPWYPKSVNSLSESASYLNQCTSVILLSDEKGHGEKYLLPVAEKLGKFALPGEDAELLFVTTEHENDKSMSQRLREFAKLPDAEEKKQLLVILDIPARRVYEHQEIITSPEQVQSIVDDFKNKKLEYRSLQ